VREEAGVALVVLAGGASARLGFPKATARLGQETVLARLLRGGSIWRAAPPLVVAGAHAREIAAELPPGCELAVNESWCLGRTGSIQVAIAARPGLDLCLAPVDVPAVSGEVFEALARFWEHSGRPPRGWLAPRFQPDPSHTPRFGHPLIVGRELLQEVLRGPRARPLREFREMAEPLLSVPVADEGVLLALDEPADWERLRKRFPS
jgi:CTP:molybdopterin cytidylyltransferase MocA